MQKKILTGINANACVELSDIQHLLCPDAVVAGKKVNEATQKEVGFAILDRNTGLIGYADTPLINMLGASSMEALCATPLNKIHITAESLAAILEQMATIPLGQSATTVILLKHADGTILKGRAILSPFTYANLNLISINIIEHTQSENRLQLMESAIHLLHLDDTALSGNAFFEKLLEVIRLFIPNVDGMVIARLIDTWVTYPYSIDSLDKEAPIPHELAPNNGHMSDAIITTGKLVKYNRNTASQRTRRDAMFRLGVPLIYNEKIFGSIILQNYTTEYPYGPAEEEILHFITETVAAKLVFHAQRLEHENQISQLKTRDQITGLLNRESFLIALENQLKQNIHGSLFVFDIKNFRELNVSLGDEGGNKILQQVARWLQSLAIPSTLGRLSNDEFALFTPEITGTDHVISTVHDILSILHRPILQEEQTIFLNFRIGIAINNSKTAIKILEHATTALIYAKKDKTPQAPSYLIYNEQTKATVSAQEQLERDVLQAYAEKELTIYVQPKYSLTGKLLGGETLLRMTGKYAHISPDQFIPIFEAHGLISEITFDVVLEQTGKTLYKNNRPEAVISINIAPQTLHDARIVEKIQTVLKKYKLQPKQLELEITERMVNEDAEHPENSDNIETLILLQRNGHEISLDDFGTAYSNLSRFGAIPFNTIKIDKSFLGNNTLIQAILNLAKGFQKKVVIEGVEHVSQLQVFRAPEYANISIAVQGFLFGKPMPQEEFLALRETHSHKGTRVAATL